VLRRGPKLGIFGPSSCRGAPSPDASPTERFGGGTAGAAGFTNSSLSSTIPISRGDRNVDRLAQRADCVADASLPCIVDRSRSAYSHYRPCVPARLESPLFTEAAASPKLLRKRVTGASFGERQPNARSDRSALLHKPRSRGRAARLCPNRRLDTLALPIMMLARRSSSTAPRFPR
jgi:hypothetical protein